LRKQGRKNKLSSILGKAWLPAVAALALFAAFAFGNQVRTAEADVVDVDLVIATFLNDDTACDETGPFNIPANNSESNPLDIADDEILALCLEVDSNATGSIISADSNDHGQFIAAICGDEDDDGDDFEIPDDNCENVAGIGTDDIEIVCGAAAIVAPAPAAIDGFSDCDDNVDAPGVGDVMLAWICEEDEAAVTEILISQTGDLDAEIIQSLWVRCQVEPDTVTVTATPSTVEIVPAVGSSAHSRILITLSGDGMPVSEDTEVDISVPKCAIEIGSNNPDSSPLTDSTDDGDNTATASDDEDNVSDVTSGPNAGKASQLVAWFHADWNNCTPGDVVVTVTVEVDDGADIVRTVTIKVVGPPAFITATAAPDRLICGEKSTITVTVKDALQQNVSDNTRVELISNWGSVIAGTGATLGFPGTGPVNPLASSAAATYNGVAIAYLLTSNNHVGAYEVVAATGGTVGFYNPWEPGGEELSDPYFNDFGTNGLDRHDYQQTNALLYGGAPITTQVTVTCSLPAAPVAPTVTAPVTGTGSITPPNTGDAGLASSSSNAMLFVIVGAAAFVLAGIASVSYARR
jgi:hypothetical protein